MGFLRRIARTPPDATARVLRDAGLTPRHDRWNGWMFDDRGRTFSIPDPEHEAAFAVSVLVGAELGDDQVDLPLMWDEQPGMPRRVELEDPDAPGAATLVARLEPVLERLLVNGACRARVERCGLTITVLSPSASDGATNAQWLVDHLRVIHTGVDGTLAAYAQWAESIDP